MGQVQTDDGCKEASEMTFEINKHDCEICTDIHNKDKDKPIQKAKVAMNGKDYSLHYCCEKHALELWDKLGKP